MRRTHNIYWDLCHLLAIDVCEESLKTKQYTQKRTINRSMVSAGNRQTGQDQASSFKTRSPRCLKMELEHPDPR